MTAPFVPVLVISTNNVGARTRPAFNERFDMVTAWLRNHSATKTRIVFVGEDFHESPELFDLTMPAKKLVIPALGPGNLLGRALSNEWGDVSSSAPPALIVVLSTMLAIDSDTIEMVIHREPDPAPRTCILFLVGEDAAGRSGWKFASSLAKRYSHVATVLPGEDSANIGGALDHLLSLATPSE